MSSRVVVAGAFDDLRSRDVRFLEQASRLGNLTALLWTDDLIHRSTGKPPKFPQGERLYFLNAIRFVDEVRLVDGNDAETLAALIQVDRPAAWAVMETEYSNERRALCERLDVACHVVADGELQRFPTVASSELPLASDGKRVIVTGCYDWLHSGHVRFFEEVSSYGELYVVVGNDANIELLKGRGHPLLRESERRYMVSSIRYVKQALVSSGTGWLDAEPEIQWLHPDIYAVNEDGDRGGKREFCLQRGIEYLVLQRTPAPGLPQRTSTNLRGF
jgi:cytidyltransferase-like protein